MADKWATKSGNWSDSTVWNGGALPQAGDDVYADTFTVTIDQDITVGSLRTTQRTGGTAGGGFACSTAGRVITLTNTTTGIWPGTTSVLAISNATGTITLACQAIYHNGATNTTNCVTFSGAGTLAVSAPLGVTGGANTARYAIAQTANGTLNASAVTFTGGANGGSAVWVGGAIATVNLTGDLYNGTHQALTLSATTAVTATIVGNIYATGGSGAGAVGWVGAGTLTITGNLFAGTTNAASRAVDLSTGTPTVVITGSLIGTGTAFALYGTSTPTVSITGAVGYGGISLTGAHTLTVTGAMTAGAGTHALESSSGSATNILSGPFISASNGYMPVYAMRATLVPGSTTYFRLLKLSGGTFDFVAQNAVPAVPSPADVRYGTSYAGGLSTGTCRVPVAADVVAGALVDATVGTAVLTSKDFWDHLVTNVTAGSLGERLANALTLDAIASYLDALES